MTMRADVSFGVETTNVAKRAMRTANSTMPGLASLIGDASSGKIKSEPAEKLTKSAKKAKKTNLRGSVSNAGDAFGLIYAALYNRLEQEDEIDRRMLKDFLDNMGEAKPLTNGERALIRSLTTLSREVEEHGKRVPGTVNDPVEKFIFWPKGSSNAIGKSAAKIDVSAKELFAELWVQNTHKSKQRHLDAHGDLPRAVWGNLDGTRSLQVTTSKKFPKGMTNRYFELWHTWEARTLEDGRKEFLIGEDLG